MSVRMEHGVVLDDGSYLCDGCNVNEPHGHRCHRGDGADGRVCGCERCAGADQVGAGFAQLLQCEHYEPTSTGLLSDGTTKPVDPTTCASCGGDGRRGPSCLCPVFGEEDEDDG